MARGYKINEIKEKLVDVLSDSKTGCSGVEISEKLGINRVTMTKYLNIFAAEGLIRQKNIGNVTLWFIEEGAEQFQFPDDYFLVKTKFIEYLTSGTENQVYTLIRNCLHSDAKISKLMTEVITPAIDSVKELYEEAKIGNSELNYFYSIISNSISLADLIFVEPEPGKNVIILSADPQGRLLSEAAAASFHSENWNVFPLGDMSESINVLFDLDLQKLLTKIWKQKSGVMIIVVFSETEEGLNFFAEATNSVKEKIGKNLFLVLCGEIDKKTKISADLTAPDLETVLQWSQTVFESSGK